MARFIRSRKVVCKERAKAATKKKYDSLISEKREEYSRNRSPKIMQQIIKLSKEKNKFHEKAYNYYLDNYVKASDSIASETTKEKRSRFSLKEFSDYMIEHLSEI